MFEAKCRQTIPPSPGCGAEDGVRVAFHQSDYDGASALYERLPTVWDDPGRGTVPLAWGVNPNLIRNYPDVADYVLRTRTARDFLAEED